MAETPSRSGLLSIIVPTLNRFELVTETLSCLVRQEYRPVEIIVVDDCSKDDTVERLQHMFRNENFENLSFQFVRLNQTGGAANARNIGLDSTRGEYVCFIDSDDLIDPRKLSRQVQELHEDVTLDFTYGPIKSLEKHVTMYGARPKCVLDACIRQLNAPFFHTMGPVFRKRFLDSVGRWDVSLPPFEDWEYYLRVTYQQPRYAWVSDGVGYYRTEESRTGCPSTSPIANTRSSI